MRGQERMEGGREMSSEGKERVEGEREMSSEGAREDRRREGDEQ